MPPSTDGLPPGTPPLGCARHADPRNPVYCGIDTIDLAQAAKLIQSIAGGPKPAVGGIKLGLEFFLAHGAPGVRYAFPAPVRATGVGFFLDLKLHDIPNTVAGGIRAVVDLAPTFITIHASGGRDDDEGRRPRARRRRPARLGVPRAEAARRHGADLARQVGPRGDRRDTPTPSEQVLRLAEAGARRAASTA